jgi:hypothetical protein
MAVKCCSPEGPRELRVGDRVVRVTGLQQVLRKLYLAGWQPEQAGLAEQLVSGLRAAGNFIARGTEPQYARSLLRLYGEFFHERQKISPAEPVNSQQGGTK